MTNISDIDDKAEIVDIAGNKNCNEMQWSVSVGNY